MPSNTVLQADMYVPHSSVVVYDLGAETPGSEVPSDD